MTGLEDSLLHFKLAFIGFGVVGQGFCQLLLELKQELKIRHNLTFNVVAIADKLMGSIYHPEGLNLERLMGLISKTGKIINYQDAQVHNWNSLETITKSKADIIIEVSWTNLETGEPALTYIKTALSQGKHVITTNKGPSSLKAKLLLEMAKKHNVEFKFEGTVLSGTPVISLGLNYLLEAKIEEIHGILNGTSNYILTQMENGFNFQEALKQAQELGYAEKDPTSDVEGWDAMGKLIILANVIFGYSLTINDIEREGITNITINDIQQAKTENTRWKPMASLIIQSDGLKAKIGPQKISFTHQFANISGPTNALLFRTKYLGDVTIIGPGAGRVATGYALLTDLLEINRNVSKIM